MPTYTINGKKVKTDRQLTDAEIEEIAAELGAPRQAAKKETQPSEEPSFGSQVLSDLIGSGAMLGTAQMATGFSPLALGKPTPSMTQDEVATARENLNKQLNLPDNLSAKRLAATAVTGAFDPSNAVFPAGGTIKTLAQGAAGAVGGLLGAEAGQSGFGGVGGLLGGVGGGIAGAMGVNTVMGTIPSIYSGVKGMLGGAKETVANVANTAGGAKAAAAATTALSSNPDLAAQLMRAKEIESLTGVKLPVLPASGGDTTLRTLAMSQAGKADNASFTASMSNQYKTAQSLIDQSIADAALGKKTVEQAFADRVAARIKAEKEAAAAMQKASSRREQGLGAIDDRIKELTSGLSTEAGSTEIGTRLTNLIDARETAIRKELSPRYEDLIKQADKEGIKLPAAQVEELYSYAKDERNADIFNKFPYLFKNINQVFAPVVKPVSSKFAEKYPQMVKAAQDAQFKDIPLDQLDSLKRNVNKAIRESSDNDQRRILGELKTQVDTAIGKVDPKFSEPYKALDKEYAMRLGIPYSEAGVVQVDRAKFVENTIPAITNNASSLKQVLGVMGDTPEAYKIIKDAFLYKIGNDKSIISTATGELNPSQLRRYLSKNKELIDLVPGLRDDLEKTASKVDELVINRDRILDAEKKAKLERIQDIYTQASGTKDGINGVVRNAMTTPAKLEELLSIAGKDVVAKEGIKIAMLDNVMNMAGNKLDYFKENSKAFETVFGKGYMPKLEALIEASQRIKENPFDPRVNVKTVTKTGFEQATGTAPAQAASLYRNHLQSTFFKVSTLLSRFTQNKMGQREAADIQRFLLDPEAITKTAQALHEFNTKGMSDKAVSLGKELAKNSAFAAAFGSLQGVQASNRTSEKPAPEVDPSLLQGWE